MFNLSEEMIKRQCNVKGVSCDYNTPIETDETLEPCIRGAEKILNDPNTREMVKKVMIHGSNKL